jgi:hypothetical protein
MKRYQKIVFLICFWLLAFGYGKAQNLVNNSYFEIYDTCPNYPNQISRAVGWINADSRTSPDYYNSCPNINSANGINVPYTQFGYQLDCCGGQGYVGIYTFNKFFPNDGKEYIQTKLVDTLKSGHKYLASMYVNNVNDYNYALATMGMLFTNIAIQGPSNVGFINIPNPQVKNTTLLNDTINWMLVQDTIIATGGELYLTIGNFSYDSLSDTVRVFNTFNQDYAYYYIDGVSVYDIATLGVNEIKNRSLQINLYPNPNDGKLYISNFDANEKNVYIEITDVTGKLVIKQQSQINNGLVELNLDLNNGVYLVKAINSKGSSQLNKIIISK